MSRFVSHIASAQAAAIAASPVSFTPLLLFRAALAALGGRASLLTRFSVLTAVSVLCAGMGFLVTTAVANILGRAAFGQLALAVSLGTCGGVIVRFGMDRTLVRDLIHFSAHPGRHVAASLVVRAAVFLVLLAGLFAWQLLLPARALPWPLALIAVAISLSSLDMQGAYDAASRTNRHAACLLAQKSFYLLPVAFVVLAMPSRLSLGFIALSLFASVLIGLALQLPWAMRQVRWRPLLPILHTSLAAARANAWIWLSAIACLSFGALTQIILQGSCGSAELGAYAAAWQIASAVTLILYQVGRLGNARVSRITLPGTPAALQLRTLARYSAIMLAACLLLAVPLLVAPSAILSLFFVKDYASAARVLQLMGVYEIIFALGIVASQYLVCARLVKSYFCTVVGGGALGLLLCGVLSNRYAALGAAASLLISHGLAIVLQFVIALYRLRRDHE